MAVTTALTGIKINFEIVKVTFGSTFVLNLIKKLRLVNFDQDDLCHFGYAVKRMPLPAMLDINQRRMSEMINYLAVYIASFQYFLIIHFFKSKIYLAGIGLKNRKKPTWVHEYNRIHFQE